MAKFYLYIEEGCNSVLKVQDIDNWLLVLSEKEIMEFTLINMDETLIQLTTRLFSCLKLKHLELFNCHISPIDGFGGFPNLLSLDLSEVEFRSYTCGEFISHCPLLEILELRSNSSSKIKGVEIAKLGYLKVLNLPLCELDNMAMITSSSIFQLIGCFSKLQELNLNFWVCK
ncbi:putative F-box-like domain superfamily protein, partial [Tanacetum coccineum]